MLALNEKVQAAGRGLPEWLQLRADLILGLVLCAVLAAGAMWLDRVAWLQAHGLSVAIQLKFAMAITGHH